MKVKRISTYEELLKLKDNWTYLFKNSGTDNIFTSWEWCALWWKHFGQNEQLMVLVVEEGREIIGIAPLMMIKGDYSTLWKPIIRFLGEDMMADYMDFLIMRNHEEVIYLILNFLQKMKNWGRIDLKRIPESSISFEIIKELLTNLSYPSFVRIDCVSPYVKIEGTWDDYYKSLSKGLRQDIRTSLNKLHRTGEVSFERCNKNSLDSCLEELYEIHRERQAFKSGESIFGTQSKREFYSDLASTFAERDWADISTLRVNDQSISFVFALKYNRVFYYWIPAFNPEYSKYSPGKVHLRSLIEKSFEENDREFDFMIGDETYKLRWVTNTKRNYEIRIYRNSFLQKLDYLRIRLREILRDIKNKYSLLGKLWVRISKVKLL